MEAPPYALPLSLHRANNQLETFELEAARRNPIVGLPNFPLEVEWLAPGAVCRAWRAVDAIELKINSTRAACRASRAPYVRAPRRRSAVLAGAYFRRRRNDGLAVSTDHQRIEVKTPRIGDAGRALVLDAACVSPRNDTNREDVANAALPQNRTRIRAHPDTMPGATPMLAPGPGPGWPGTASDARCRKRRCAGTSIRGEKAKDGIRGRGGDQRKAHDLTIIGCVGAAQRAKCQVLYTKQEHPSLDCEGVCVVAWSYRRRLCDGAAPRVGNHPARQLRRHGFAAHQRSLTET